MSWGEAMEGSGPSRGQTPAEGAEPRGPGSRRAGPEPDRESTGDEQPPTRPERPEGTGHGADHARPEGEPEPAEQRTAKEGEGPAPGPDEENEGRGTKERHKETHAKPARGSERGREGGRRHGTPPGHEARREKGQGARTGRAAATTAPASGAVKEGTLWGEGLYSPAIMDWGGGGGGAM